MISSLDRKMIRDLLAIKGQALAICLVIAAGVATLVMSLCALASLTNSKDSYYDRYRFADVFAYVKRAPRKIVDRIEQIPGVARAQARIVLDVTLNVADMLEPATGRLISIPDDHEPQLNSLHLRRGRWIEPRKAEEVLVAESFAEAHQLQPGDSLTAVINGRYQTLRIVGIVLSPEYIIQIPPGNLLPDNKQFGIFWMSQHQLEAAYDMKEAFNNVSVTLLRGARQAEVIKRMDEILESYGSFGAYGRESHVSHQFISDEIRQLRSMALVAPVLFLLVASFLLNIVIARIIGLQREQIAALKAFGYTNWQVGVHYLKMVFAITLIGVVLGTAFGWWLGKSLTELYARFYKFPVFFFEFDLSTLSIATALSCGAALLGTLASLRKAARLPPAQAMRPEPPANYRETIVERTGIGFLFPQVLRMILRKLERRPLKALLSCIGISMAVAIMILGSFTLDAVMYIMDFQFRVAQRQDMMISFVEPTNRSTLHDVAHLPGVIQEEPFRVVATRFRNGHRSRRVGIMGLESRRDLFRVFDTDERVIEIPPHGLLLSDKLAQLMGVSLGDVVDVEVLEGKRGRYQVPVASVIQEFSGTNAYMNMNALNRMLQEGHVISGAFIKADSLAHQRIYETLKATPRVSGVTIKAAALKRFEDTVAENLLVMRGFNILFAAVIAFGVVYNSARISLSEQSRELATLRVIGFSRLEVSLILLGELALLTALAIPLGCAIGYGFAALSTLSMDTEIYRIPLVVNRSTFGFAIVTVIVATFISSLIVRRKIDRLDLVSVLKTKE